MTEEEIVAMKRKHNAAQKEGRIAYARVLEMRKICDECQRKLQEAEGDEYDAIPLIFGAGFWIDGEST